MMKDIGAAVTERIIHRDPDNAARILSKYAEEIGVERGRLLECLLNTNVPREILPILTDVLIRERPLKEQRAALLESLLERDVPNEVMPALVSALLEKKVPKEQRIVLLNHLLEQPVPQEILPTLTDALIRGKPEKILREELLQYLLSQPVNQKQMISIFKSLMEQMGEKKLPEIDTMAQCLCEYRETLAMLRRWVDKERPAWKEGQTRALFRVVVEGESLETVFLDMLCEGNFCYLADACIEFIDRKQLWLMFQELLFEEEYYCEFDSDEPYILDCGVNIGLSVYYTKQRYPKAHIVGFEPWSVAYECAVHNVERNHWDNVTICHAALGAKESVMQLISMQENSLASTLTNRMDDYIADKHIEKLVEDVQVIPLSPYMDRPVDFLKMDIEGMEAQVLRECGDVLRQVKLIFCEYHYGTELKDNSLAEILVLLEGKGFNFEVSKSSFYAELTKRRPFSHVGKTVSELIWARRIEEK